VGISCFERKSRTSGNKTPRAPAHGHWGNWRPLTLHQTGRGAGRDRTEAFKPLIDDQKDSRRTRSPARSDRSRPSSKAQEQQGSHHPAKPLNPGSTDLIHGTTRKFAQGGGDGVTQPKKNGFDSASGLLSLPNRQLNRDDKRPWPPDRQQPATALGSGNQRRSRSRLGPTCPDRHGFTRHKRCLPRIRDGLNRGGNQVENGARFCVLLRITKQWKQQRFQPILAEVASGGCGCCHSRWVVPFHCCLGPLLCSHSFFVPAGVVVAQVLFAPWTLSKSSQVACCIYTTAVSQYSPNQQAVLRWALTPVPAAPPDL